jgi:hypothetical protein
MTVVSNELAQVGDTPVGFIDWASGTRDDVLADELHDGGSFEVVPWTMGRRRFGEAKEPRRQGIWLM